MIAGGLFGVAAVLGTSLALDAGHGAVLLGVVTFGLALSMGAAMAPATESVMSAVPEAKAGVGSAMSDVTRQVGGALGVAVIGSIIGSAYAARHARRAAAAASRSAPRTPWPQRLGGVPGRSSPTPPRAFTDALGIGLTAAAVVALAGARWSCCASPTSGDAAVRTAPAAPAPSQLEPARS